MFRGFIKTKTAVVFVFCFMFLAFSFSLTFAGDVLFETLIPWYLWWSETSWGTGGFTYVSTVAMGYRPSTDQEVCMIKTGLYKSSSPTDSVAMTVREGGNGYPTGGQIIGTSTVSADQVAVSPFLPQQTVYTAFTFSPCLNLTADINYQLVFSRTQPGGTGHYVSQISNLIFYPQTRFWAFVPVNGVWQEKVGYEPALRLEGPDEPKRTPVLIIPGIAGSELKAGDNLIWADLGQMFLDINDEFITENLGLDEDGQPINNETSVGEVIERIFSVPFLDVNIFQDLEEQLELSDYTIDQNLFYFPYDWRLDLTDTTSLLNQKIEEIKLQTGSEKINIVAHSMGGLLTKEYVRQYGKESVDKLIFVGTPHLGAPKAGKIILAGDRMGIPWLEEDRIKEIGEHSIAVHELLPNQSYFDTAGPYIKQVNPLDYEETKQLLLEQGSTFNVFESAESFFNHNLENLDFSGINAYNITGCANGTQGGYEVRNDGSIALTKYRAGDQTVPLVSGDAISLPSENKFYSTEGSHAELPSRPGVRNLIADILDDQPITSYENVSADFSTCGIEGQELIWRSPVEVHIYDSQNRHTGPIEGGIEYSIPGIDYEIYGHEKFIFVPTGDGETYRVVARGLDNGTFDLLIRNNENGEVTGAFLFNDIPVTATTDIEFNIFDDGEFTEIEVDEDGDGNFVLIPATSFLSGEESEDITLPTIDIISPASPSYERSFILPLNIHVSDENSGILSTDIRFDGNPFASLSIDLFFYSLGSHSLDITATDRAGNTATDSFNFQIIATPDSAISDIERAYELGWIKKKGVKNGLINKLRSAIKIEKRIKLLEKKLSDKPKVIKKIEQLVKRLDRLLAIQFLNQLEKEYNKGNINEQAYNLLKEDIKWLLN